MLSECWTAVDEIPKDIQAVLYVIKSSGCL